MRLNKAKALIGLSAPFLFSFCAKPKDTSAEDARNAQPPWSEFIPLWRFSPQTVPAANGDLLESYLRDDCNFQLSPSGALACVAAAHIRGNLDRAVRFYAIAKDTLPEAGDGWVFTRSFQHDDPELPESVKKWMAIPCPSATPTELTIALTKFTTQLVNKDTDGGQKLTLRWGTDAESLGPVIWSFSISKTSKKEKNIKITFDADAELATLLSATNLQSLDTKSLCKSTKDLASLYRAQMPADGTMSLDITWEKYDDLSKDSHSVMKASWGEGMKIPTSDPWVWLTNKTTFSITSIPDRHEFGFDGNLTSDHFTSTNTLAGVFTDSTSKGEKETLKMGVGVLISGTTYRTKGNITASDGDRNGQNPATYTVCGSVNDKGYNTDSWLGFLSPNYIKSETEGFSNSQDPARKIYTVFSFLENCPTFSYLTIFNK